MLKINFFLIMCLLFTTLIFSLKIVQKEGENFYLGEKTIDTTTETGLKVNLLSLFRELKAYIGIDLYNISSIYEEKTISNEIDLKITSTYSNENMTFKDFAYDNNTRNLFLLENQGISKMKIGFKEGNNYFDTSTVVSIYQEENNPFNAIYIATFENQESLMILISNKGLYYSLFKEEQVELGNITELPGTNYFDSNMDILVYQSFLFIPNKVEGLRIYLYKDKKLKLINSTLNDAIFKDTPRNITSIIMGGKEIFVSDFNYGIYRYTFSYSLDSFILHPHDFLAIRSIKSIRYHSKNKIETIIAIQEIEESGKFIEFTYNEAKNSWKKTKEVELYARADVLSTDEEFCSIVMENMVTILELDAISMHQLIALPTVYDSLLIKQENLSFNLFMTNTSLSIAQIKENDLFLNIHFKGVYYEEYTIKAISHECLNEIDFENYSMSYNQNTTCTYSLNLFISYYFASKMFVTIMYIVFIFFGTIGIFVCAFFIGRFMYYRALQQKTKYILLNEMRERTTREFNDTETENRKPMKIISANDP